MRTPVRTTAACLIFCALCATTASAEYQTGDVLGRVPVMASIMEQYPLSGECSLGGVVADALRYAAGADIAVANGGDLANDLGAGEVSYSDAVNVFAENRRVATAEISPAELRSMLEHAVSHIVLDADAYIDRETSAYDGFPQVSGFVFEYDASAAAGSRILSVTLLDGTKLDLTETEAALTLAASEYMLLGGYGYAGLPGARRLDLTLAEALSRYIEEQGFGLTEGSRITARGSSDGAIVDMISRPVLVIACASLAVLLVLIRWLSGRRLNP